MNMPPLVRKVPQYCYQCVAGPDLLTVKVEDGVATEIEPNFRAAEVHPGGGSRPARPYRHFAGTVSAIPIGRYASAPFQAQTARLRRFAASWKAPGLALQRLLRLFLTWQSPGPATGPERSRCPASRQK